MAESAGVILIFNSTVLKWTIKRRKEHSESEDSERIDKDIQKIKKKKKHGKRKTKTNKKKNKSREGKSKEGTI